MAGKFDIGSPKLRDTLHLFQLIIFIGILLGFVGDYRSRNDKVDSFREQVETLRKQYEILQTQVNGINLSLAVSNERFSTCCTGRR